MRTLCTSSKYRDYNNYSAASYPVVELSITGVASEVTNKALGRIGRSGIQLASFHDSCLVVGREGFSDAEKCFAIPQLQTQTYTPERSLPDGFQDALARIRAEANGSTGVKVHGNS